MSVFCATISAESLGTTESVARNHRIKKS